jgi:hypothetical protein
MELMVMDQGWCAGTYFLRIETGDFDGIDLGGRTLVQAVDFPGPTILDGQGTARVYVDDGASDEQVEALESIMQGKRGGPTQALEPLFTTWLSTQRTPITVEEENGTVKATIGDYGKIVSSKLKNEAGEVMTMQNAGFVLAFQFKDQTAELAPSDGTRWTDSELPHQFEAKSGAAGTFSWSGE